MSLRRRLTLLSALAVALAVVIVSAIVYLLVRDRLTDQIDETLEERAGAARVVVRGTAIAPAEAEGPIVIGGSGTGVDGGAPPGVPPGIDQLPPEIREQVEQLPPEVRKEIERARRDRAEASDRGEVRRTDTFQLPAPPLGDFVPRGQLIDESGAVEREVRGSIPVSDEAKQVAAGERDQVFENVDTDEGELRVLTTPAGTGAALQVARPFDEVNDTLSNLVLILTAVSLGGVGLAAGFGLLVARTSLAPAAAVSGAAREVAKTKDLTRRIEVRGTDELGTLASSFNEMMEALEQSVGAQRRLVADASHELRTPLATLRTNIETLAGSSALDQAERDRIIADLDAETEELTRVVTDVVELAREPAAEGTAVKQDVRLDELAAAAIERARRRGRGLRFEPRLEPCLVNGDPDRLDRAIGNLLDNAVKWSSDAKAIEVAVADGRVSIRDHGPGFAEDDLPNVFDRFYRADDARGMPGSGLGLAIVRRIAEEHGGRAIARNAPDGGAVVEIELPTLALGDS